LNIKFRQRKDYTKERVVGLIWNVFENREKIYMKDCIIDIICEQEDRCGIKM